MLSTYDKSVSLPISPIIITALTLATAPAVAWQEVAIDCGDWLQAVKLMQCCARSAVDLYLCSLLEKAIVEHIPNWSGCFQNQHRLLLLVAPDGVTTIERLANAAGAAFNLLGTENKRSCNGIVSTQVL